MFQLPKEVTLKIISECRLSPKEMIRLLRTSTAFNNLLRTDSLWRNFVPESIRYQSNLFYEYIMLMKSNTTPPLIKFLVHEKGYNYDDALCIRIRDNRVIRLVIKEILTLDEAQQLMRLSVKLREDVLSGRRSLASARDLNILSAARFYQESGFPDIALYQGGVLDFLLQCRSGLQMLLEGLVNPNNFNRKAPGLGPAMTQNPFVLFALREGLITDGQLIRIYDELENSNFIDDIFTKEGLQAIRMGYINLDDAIISCDNQKRITLKDKIMHIENLEELDNESTPRHLL